MDYGELTRKLVADAIINKIPGLNKTVDFLYFVSAGVYDPEADTTTPVFDVVGDVVVVEAKTTFEDVSDHKVVFSDKKLIVPGTSLPKAPETDTDKVRINAQEWQVRKTVEVPGGSVYIVFAHRT